MVIILFKLMIICLKVNLRKNTPAIEPVSQRIGGPEEQVPVQVPDNKNADFFTP
jgi:ribosomal protein S7